MKLNLFVLSTTHRKNFNGCGQSKRAVNNSVGFRGDNQEIAKADVFLWEEDVLQAVKKDISDWGQWVSKCCRKNKMPLAGVYANFFLPYLIKQQQEKYMLL